MTADEDQRPPAGIEADAGTPGENAPLEGKPPDGEEPAARLGVSLMITRRQKVALRERGFSEDAIQEMTPAEAHDHLGM